MNKECIIILPVYNSFDNLYSIINEIKNININTKKIIIIDNNSSIPINTKLEILKNNKEKNKIHIDLIINKKNYGIGGSQKIILNFLKNEKFDYIINLQTSGRFSVKEVLKSIKNEDLSRYDYLIFSRFLNKDSAKNYNFIRRIGNLFFSFITRLFTDCNVSDPGCAINVINYKLYERIIDDGKIFNLTNNSHFPHLFNIVIFEKQLLYKELSMNWGEGNIKSHLNTLPYVIKLSYYLFRYLVFKKFADIQKINFDFTKF